MVTIRRMDVRRRHAPSGAELALRDSAHTQKKANWQRAASAMATVALSAHDDMALVFLHQIWRDVNIGPAARDAQSGRSDAGGGMPEPEVCAVVTGHVWGRWQAWPWR
jgi:hypothetical protein